MIIHYSHIINNVQVTKRFWKHHWFHHVSWILTNILSTSFHPREFESTVFQINVIFFYSSNKQQYKWENEENIKSHVSTKILFLVYLSKWKMKHKRALWNEINFETVSLLISNWCKYFLMFFTPKTMRTINLQ